MPSSNHPPKSIASSFSNGSEAGAARGLPLSGPMSFRVQAPVVAQLTVTPWIASDLVPSWLVPFTLDENTRFTRTPDHLLRSRRPGDALDMPPMPPLPPRKASPPDTFGFGMRPWSFLAVESGDEPIDSVPMAIAATTLGPDWEPAPEEMAEMTEIAASIQAPRDGDLAPDLAMAPPAEEAIAAVPATSDDAEPALGAHDDGGASDEAASDDALDALADVGALAPLGAAEAAAPETADGAAGAVSLETPVAADAPSDVDLSLNAALDTATALGEAVAVSPSPVPPVMPQQLRRLSRLIVVGDGAYPPVAADQDLLPMALAAGGAELASGLAEVSEIALAPGAALEADSAMVDVASSEISAPMDLAAAGDDLADGPAAATDVLTDDPIVSADAAAPDDRDADDSALLAVSVDAEAVAEPMADATPALSDDTPLACDVQAQAPAHRAEPVRPDLTETTAAESMPLGLMDLTVDEPEAAAASASVAAPQAVLAVAAAPAVVVTATLGWQPYLQSVHALVSPVAAIVAAHAEVEPEAIASATDLVADDSDDAAADGPELDAEPVARVAGLFTGDYELPPLELLAEPPVTEPPFDLSEEFLEQNSAILQQTLRDFGVRGEIIDANPGPVVTLYELEPAPGTKSSRVIGLAADIARSMSAISARVAVVEGRNVIGIELPNRVRETVWLRELLANPDFSEARAKLGLCLGKTIGGEPVIADLARMPHLLVAGTTGSGKSVAINTMILSLLYRHTPEACRLIMIDPKMLELSVYEGIPHLLTPVVTDPKKAITALKWAVREMEDRYRKMSRLGVRNIDGFNARVAEARAKGEVITRIIETGFDRETGEMQHHEEAMDLSALPFIVIIVDEMADLMMVAGKEIEGAIQRLAQMARAAGIHLVMATQRPSVDVITGTIKANFPTRISFQVTSKIDSRTILGEMGAEQLLGQGDMLYMASGGRTMRVHGPFVSDNEVEKVVAHLKLQGRPEYLDAVTSEDDEEAPAEDDGAVFDKSALGEEGDHYEQAIALVLRDRKASTSYIQRRLQIGYNKAASLMERMEQEGIVGAANHAGKREILITRAP